MVTPNWVALARFRTKPTQYNSLFLLECSALVACSAFRAEVAREHALATRLHPDRCSSFYSFLRDTRDTRVTTKQIQRFGLCRLWCACAAVVDAQEARSR